MKKCPTCEKTFDDNLRFCQTDGTPLVDVKEEAPPPDPYATMVAGRDDFAAAIPPDEPAQDDAPDEDVLEIPEPEEESDPMQTMVVSDGERKDLFEDAPPISAPPSPFSEPFSAGADDVSSAPPEPPKFSEPNLNPPSFGDLSSESPAPESPFPKEPPSFGEQPLPSQGSTQESSGASPYSTPIPSPFGEQMPPSYETPSTPPFKEPEPALNEPSDPFGASEPVNQPMQQSEWTPPAAPEQSWQNQEIGQNTPFQPPPAGNAGPNQTLAIVSLVTGILSCLCCFSILTGPAAIVMGFMAKNKISQNPNEFGGGGLALGGMITGAVGTLIGIVVIILNLMGAFANAF